MAKAIVAVFVIVLLVVLINIVFEWWDRREDHKADRNGGLK